MPSIDLPASPTLNQEYTFEGRTWLWNGTGWEVKAFVAPAGATGPTGPSGPAGAGAFSSTTTPPISAVEGDEWFDEEAGILYTYYTDANSSQWVEIGPQNYNFIGATGPVGATGVSAFASTSTPPSSPAEGDEWFDDDAGVLYTYISDASTSQWVELGPKNYSYLGPTGATGPIGPVGATGAAAFLSSLSPPASPLEGDEWFDEEAGILYTYVIDADTSQWVELGPRAYAAAAMTGPTGPTGPIGITGATGPFPSYTITTTAIDKTLVDKERCSVTAAGLTITLPASPSAGAEVSITIAGAFTDTVIARNGSNIMSLAENMTIDTAEITVTLYYVDATRGWRII
jgi:hypothetical protein